MVQIMSILWEILSILWEICYLIGIFRNHFPPPSTTILESFSGKFFLTTRAQSEKVGQISFRPPNFFLHVRPWKYSSFFLYLIQTRRLLRRSHWPENGDIRAMVQVRSIDKEYKSWTANAMKLGWKRGVMLRRCFRNVQWNTSITTKYKHNP
jgi:hypothetical protein